MIVIGSGILKEELSSIVSKRAIITDTNVGALYGKKLEGTLFTFPGGEQNKTRATKELLENQLFAHGFGKDSTLIALGGGVTTDIAGYVAATFCRGIPLVMVPTSLLGMVDASIGGKTGVNVPEGKNLVGCFYQPTKVIIDISFLKTLPQKELSYGVVEMIKHGLIADPKLFQDLETRPNIDLEVIQKAVLVKKTIVEEDEKERGKRHLLNFGHTIAHALETLTEYQLPHGEAVAIGLLVESYMGGLPPDVLQRIHRLLLRYGLSFKIPLFDEDQLLKVMMRDKKSLLQRPRFAMIKSIGTPIDFGGAYCTHVDELLIRKAIRWMNEDLCCH